MGKRIHWWRPKNRIIWALKSRQFCWRENRVISKKILLKIIVRINLHFQEKKVGIYKIPEYQIQNAEFSQDAVFILMSALLFAHWLAAIHTAKHCLPVIFPGKKRTSCALWQLHTLYYCQKILTSSSTWIIENPRAIYSVMCSKTNCRILASLSLKDLTIIKLF